MSSMSNLPYPGLANKAVHKGGVRIQDARSFLLPVEGPGAHVAPHDLAVVCVLGGGDMGGRGQDGDRQQVLEEHVVSVSPRWRVSFYSPPGEKAVGTRPLLLSENRGHLRHLRQSVGFIVI